MTFVSVKGSESAVESSVRSENLQHHLEEIVSVLLLS